MRVLMLLQHHFPPDIRVENEAASLLAAGHEVHLLCSEVIDTGPSLPPNLQDLALHSVPPTWNDLPTWKRRLMNLPLLRFINPYWVRAIVGLSRSTGGFDVIHVHDLPLVRTALKASKTLGVPVVADLHENYPMALRFYAGEGPVSRMQRFRRDPRRWERYERRSVPSCTAVIAVVEEMKQRLVAVGVRAERIAVVENFVDVDRFLSYPIDRDLQDELRDRYVISYVGGFGAHRGLETAIRAMELVARAVPQAVLLLVGDGPNAKALERLSASLSLTEHVRFAGKVDFDRVPSFIAASDVCIIPHVQSVQTEAALPHKLFQYMLLGKPVVASSCAGVARIVEDADCGVLFPPGDAGALADGLISLTDRRTREAFGERGRIAVLDRYNWSASGRKLCDLYGSLQASTHRREPASSRQD